MARDGALWRVSESDLRDLDPCKARDLLVECFLQAQSRTSKRAATALDMERGEHELRTTVRAAIRLTFKDLGCDFDNPCAADIGKVTHVLAGEARAWGTPPDVLEHHIEQMRTIERRLQVS